MLAWLHTGVSHVKLSLVSTLYSYFNMTTFNSGPCERPPQALSHSEKQHFAWNTHVNSAAMHASSQPHSGLSTDMIFCGVSSMSTQELDARERGLTWRVVHYCDGGTGSG